MDRLLFYILHNFLRESEVCIVKIAILHTLTHLIIEIHMKACYNIVKVR